MVFFDQVSAFMMGSVQGRFVRLNQVSKDILKQHTYPASISSLLGDCLALSSLLSSALKCQGLFTLQARGNGPLSLLVSDLTVEGHLRGMAQFSTLPEGDASLETLLGEGALLSFTLDQGVHTDRYQGIVELKGEGLADCLEHYFHQSVQVNTTFVSATNPDSGVAAALMLQALPGAEESYFEHLSVLVKTLKPEEMLDTDLSYEELLWRLFHQEEVRLFPPQPLVAQCRCNRRRLSDFLKTLPGEDLHHLYEKGQIKITCEFCNKNYFFYEDELV